MSVDNIKGLAHVGFFVRVIEVSKKFYTDILGFQCVFERTEPGPGGSTVTISFMRNQDAMFEMICVPGMDLPKDGCFQHFAMRVENIEEAQKKLEVLGVRTDPLVYSKETFSNGAKWVTFLGPDGEHLEITEVL